MENKNQLNDIIDSEQFGAYNRQYFLDIKKTKSQRMFLQITNRRQQTESTYSRSHIILFEDDLPFFVEAVTMLLRRHVTGNLGTSC